MNEIAIITALSFVSAMITSIFGFGAGLVLTPLLTFIMPLKAALGISSLIFFVTSGSKMIWYFKDVDWKTYRLAFGLSLFGLGAGFMLISSIEASFLEKIYAVMLVYFGIQAFVNTEPKDSSLSLYGYPVIGGLFSALVHGGGAFFIRMCQNIGLNRLQIVATVAVTHFSLAILKAVFFAGTGVIEIKYIYTLAPAYLAAIVGTRIGRTVLKNHVSEKVFSYGIGALLLVLSVKYLI
jgi:uncharacterized protein